MQFKACLLETALWISGSCVHVVLMHFRCARCCRLLLVNSHCRLFAQSLRVSYFTRLHNHNCGRNSLQGLWYRLQLNFECLRTEHLIQFFFFFWFRGLFKMGKVQITIWWKIHSAMAQLGVELYSWWLQSLIVSNICLHPQSGGTLCVCFFRIPRTERAAKDLQ